jgi:hypothetical protein
MKCQGCGKFTDIMMGLGPVRLCRDECYPDIQMEIDALRQAGEPVDVTILARRRYNRIHDHTRTERVNRRNKKLNSLAQGLGFDSLSQMLTLWKNGQIELTVSQGHKGE